MVLSSLMTLANFLFFQAVGILSYGLAKASDYIFLD
jgi:hypothetical protein